MKPLVERPSARFPVGWLFTFAYRGLVLYLLALMVFGMQRMGFWESADVAYLRAELARPRDEIVDVSRGAARDSVIEVLGLRRGERVVAINDVPATTDEVIAAWRATAAGDFLDITVADRKDTTHRVLVVIHP